MCGCRGGTDWSAGTRATARQGDQAYYPGLGEILERSKIESFLAKIMGFHIL